MRLRELASVLGAEVIGDASTQVVDVVHDSRNVTPGSLFCCVVGHNSNGELFIEQAIANGATAVLVQTEQSTSIPQVVVPVVRDSMGYAAAAVHGWPSNRLTMVGATGTNGKTTTTILLAHVLTQCGVTTSTIGSLDIGRTTPEATDIQRALARAANEPGPRGIAMEASSPAIRAGRLRGTHFHAAVFTNLGHDHIGEVHADMEDYFATKASLFTEEYASHAVINVDDPYGRRLAEQVDLPATTFRLSDAEEVRMLALGAAFLWRGHHVQLQLPGQFNIFNAIAAATTAAILGCSEPMIATALSQSVDVPGHFERVYDDDFSVFVDFAHTPEALRACLQTARHLAGPNRVVVVFGCGGDRDRAKRPLMGEVAASLADVVILTTDNPRTEDPQRIFDEIRGGMSKLCAVVIDERRQAIATAIESAGPGDVVVVAGKGAESGQIIGDVVLPFDDRETTRELLSSRSES